MIDINSTSRRTGIAKSFQANHLAIPKKGFVKLSLTGELHAIAAFAPLIASNRLHETPEANYSGGMREVQLQPEPS